MAEEKIIYKPQGGKPIDFAALEARELARTHSKPVTMTFNYIELTVQPTDIIGAIISSYREAVAAGRKVSRA